jgi:hypothetical protein
VDDLIAFLRDRLSEDEQAARIIEPGGGHQPVRWTAKPASSGTWTHLVAEVRFADDPPEIHEDYVVALVRDDRAEWAHIARHDPARVLAEVAAKRQIINRYTAQTAIQYENSIEEDRAWVLESVIRLLALPHASHPAYRESWRP